MLSSLVSQPLLKHLKRMGILCCTHLARSGDADDGGNSPSLVACLEGLPHDIDVPSAVAISE